MIRSVAAALAVLLTAPAVTETVDVGGRGMVDLAPFACSDTPRSTLVQRVCYDAARRYLLVNVRGSYLEHCELPAAIFNAFVVAPSMGQFYRQSIAAASHANAPPFKCAEDRSAN